MSPRERRVADEHLPDTEPLTWEGDLAARMVAGIRTWMTGQTERARADRARRWRRQLTGATPRSGTRAGDGDGSHDRWLAGRRRQLARILGVGVDRRLPPDLQILTPAGGLGGGQRAFSPPRTSTVAAAGAALARGPGYTVHAVRWPVFAGVDGEGLLLQPGRRPRARVVVCADADHTPEQLAGLAPGLPRAQQLARRLAENGCAVVVPQPVDRDCAHSVVRTGASLAAGPDGDILRATNMTHREFLYRAAYELGRHVIGFELETLFALLEGWDAACETAVSVVGWGEGGRLALYAAALDERLAVAGVSGAFGPREDTWAEPIERNVCGLLRDFGDAEVAALIAPRRLIVETARAPDVAGPPAATARRQGAAPGRLRTPSAEAVDEEAERASRYAAGLRDGAGFLEVIQPPGGRPGSEAFLREVLRAAGARRSLAPAGAPPRWVRGLPVDRRPDPVARRDRYLRALIAHTQVALAAAEHDREAAWAPALRHLPTGPDVRGGERGRRALSRDFESAAAVLGQRLARDVIGRLPAPRGAFRPRSRQILDEPAYRGYEVVIDVYGRDGDADHIFSFGVLLVPKGIRKGQRRPVVVCQHGLEGRPSLVADPDVDDQHYHAYACRLAERGFVTFAPQNPYTGGAEYRAIQRQANPLGWSLFSVILRQHERILEWLGALPFVDAGRIAFYGLSYGGKTAMRVPALLPGYCLSICSADYNEWIWKCASTRHRWSYMGTGEYDMPEFDLGRVCNYAEMSWLLFPRPFMVERGHHDGVAPDEWVAYEFARTRRVYALLGRGEAAEIEVFDGPHTIHGQGTFAFLHRHLNWPEPR